MYVFLSFPLGERTPTFATNPPVKFTQISSIAEGAIANWFNIETINHNGTHMDAPLHFNPQGRSMSDLAVDEFFFERPAVIDLPKGDGELITAADLEPYENDLRDVDFLFVRTGFERYRQSDPIRYGQRNPGFDGSAGEFLIERLRNLRAIGMDLPSASSALHIDDGNDFHQIVLGRRGAKRTLFIVEDCHLDQDLAGLKRVILAPIILEGLDGAPCTIFGEL